MYSKLYYIALLVGDEGRGSGSNHQEIVCRRAVCRISNESCGEIEKTMQPKYGWKISPK